MTDRKGRSWGPAPMPPSAPASGHWLSEAGREVRPIPSVQAEEKGQRKRWEPEGPGAVDDHGQVHREGYHGPH